MSKKVEKLTERLSKATSQPPSMPPLSGAENLALQAFWLELHFLPEEASEIRALHERHEILYQKYCADPTSSKVANPELIAEWQSNGKRTSEIIQAAKVRMERTRLMKARLWPDFCRRVLRLWKLAEKPGDQLTRDEAEESRCLQEWLGQVQHDALEPSSAGEAER